MKMTLFPRSMLKLQELGHATGLHFKDGLVSFLHHINYLTAETATVLLTKRKYVTLERQALETKEVGVSISLP